MVTIHRPQRTLPTTRAASTAVRGRRSASGPTAAGAELRQLVALDLLNEGVATEIAQGGQQQGEMGRPDEGPENDAAELQRAHVVQHRLALAGKDVQHGARDHAGLGAHGGPPEAEQRTVAGEEERGEETEQEQGRYHGVDDLRTFRTQSLLRAGQLGCVRRNEDDDVVEQCDGEWTQRHAVGPVTARWTRAVEEVAVPLWNGRREERDGNQAGCQAGGVQDRG